MAFDTIDHRPAFVSFYQRNFPNLQIPPMPKEADELPWSVQASMQNDDPALFQNLFGLKGKAQALPADVDLRRAQGQLTAEDAAALRESNLYWEAEQLEKNAVTAEQQETSRQIEESRKNYIEALKRSAQWGDASFGERLGMAPPSPESVARAREAWGVSGKASWELEQ